MNVRDLWKELSKQIQAEVLQDLYNYLQTQISTENEAELKKLFALVFQNYDEDREQASQSLPALLKLIPGKEEMLAYKLLSIGKTLAEDKSYKSDMFFNLSLRIYENFPESQDVKLKQATAYFYGGLICCRNKDFVKGKLAFELATVMEKSAQEKLPVQLYQSTFKELESIKNIDSEILILIQKNELNAELTFLNKSFNFDWTNYKTYNSNENFKEPSDFHEFDSNPDLLDEEGQQLLGEIAYKLATYFLYVQVHKDPYFATQMALQYLEVAKLYLKDHDELAWVDNHFVFCYQILMTLNKANPEKRQHYFNEAEKKYSEVIRDYNCDNNSEIKHVKIFAFAFCVKGLCQLEMGALDDAEASFKFALHLYTDFNLLDDQYARARNFYAMVLAENHKTAGAKHNFSELEKYWEKREDTATNPCALRFYLAYGSFIYETYPEKPEKVDKALDLLEKAYKIALATNDVDASLFAQEIHQQIEQIKEEQQAKLLTANGIEAANPVQSQPSTLQLR